MIIQTITPDDIGKIFGNNENRKAYLRELFLQTNNTTRIGQTTNELNQQITDTWDYEVSKGIIREMFKRHPKYAAQRGLKEEIDNAIKAWNDLGFGELEWPFSAAGFDQHVHMLNRNQEHSEIEKDRLLANEAIKFRRIKQINALRNDYIEYLIFQNENVIPTLGNRRAVDFYINGEPYDQKVGKSVGKAFMEAYGTEYREIALAHPELVAKSLYENQDSERFGDEPRLLIVYLDSNVDSEKIEQQLSEINFNAPYHIAFCYTHTGTAQRTYETKCFVVLLHN